MLTFVGLGLYDEADITLKGLKAVRDADVVFVEFYTSKLAGTTLERLEATLRKKIKVLTREDVEERPEEVILEEAKKKSVVLLCGGDPMVATTHVDLRLRAIELGIETRVIHAPSILSAAPGICGLQSYKFGKSATVAPPYKGRIPETPYDTLMLNRKHGLHTLLLLDISMTVRDAIELLFSIESQKRQRGEATSDIERILFVGIARAGAEKPIVRADLPQKLKEYDFEAPPHTLIAVGSLHFIEKEALMKLAGASPEIF